MPRSREQKIGAFRDLELLCDIILKALFAKWFESQLKRLRCYGIQKNVCSYCIYWSLVWNLLSLCLWHLFNTNPQRMRQIGEELLCVLEALYKLVDER